MAINVTKPSVNLREKLNELETNKGLKGNEILQAETAQEVRSLIGAGRKNLIINGDFQVSQRGDYTTATAAAGYQLDRWSSGLFGGSSGNIQHKTDQALPNGVVTNSLRLTITSAISTYYALWQWIEGYKQFRGQTTTLSFWYKSNTDQALNYYNYVTQQHVNVPNTNGVWTKFSHTYAWGATGNTKTRLEFYPHGLTMQNNDYIEIAQVQLELGSVATDFEHRSYGEELALCQRYYQKISSNGLVYTTYSTTQGYMQVPTPVQMRVLPSISWNIVDRVALASTSNITTNITYWSSYSNSPSSFFSFQARSSVALTSGLTYVMFPTAVTYMALNAEL